MCVTDPYGLVRSLDEERSHFVPQNVRSIDSQGLLETLKPFTKYRLIVCNIKADPVYIWDEDLTIAVSFK
jgi:hypothetical protein